MTEGVSIIIPTYNGGETFRRCLDGIKSQEFFGHIDIVVVDSGSSDGSVELARDAGAKVSCIENKNFHHSKTRNSALKLAQFEKIVFLVQDAIPVSPQWLSQLCAALDEEDVASVSCRQIPHTDAEVSARFEVEFHGEYLGTEPYLKYIESPDTFVDLPYDDALHLIRHDNVCSIYRRHLLERFPFPDVEFGEDMAWAHAMILRGHKILYDPRICVRHSHNRPPEYRFKRSIASSRASAEILGRVKEDITYLSVSDLINISENFRIFSNDLKKQWPVRSGLYSPKIDLAHSYLKVIKFVPFLKNVYQLLKKIRRQSGKVTNSLRVQHVYTNHVCFIMSIITARYSINSVEDYAYCVDQVTANTLGMLYGELYAGYKLKGRVPREIEELFRPYLKGV